MWTALLNREVINPARLKPNGRPRHLWCEQTDRGIWSRIQRPAQADRKVLG